MPKKDNGVIGYIRTCTFQARIEETGKGEMTYILNEDHIKPGSLVKTKYFHTLQACII